MKITKSQLPPTSKLYGSDFDFVDSYQGSYLDKKNEISSKEIGKAFFTSAPSWSEHLFELRNKIVSVFGLKTPEKMLNRKEQLESFNCEPNEKLGLFRVYDKTENEVILGEDDKHLNFRISLLKELDPNNEDQKILIISTTVVFNNWFGKLYFIPVKPFHSLLVPQILKGIIRQLENKKVNLLSSEN